MKVALPYGETYLEADISDAAVVLPNIRSGPRVVDARKEILRALEYPIDSPRLRSLVRHGDRIAVVVNDATRPTPTAMMLEGILAEISHAGVSYDNVTVVVATGSHRPATTTELEKILGAASGKVAVVNHDCKRDELLQHLGTTPTGLPIYVNRLVSGSDLVVLTGTIAPHHSAGFSGGRKSVIPGVAGNDTLRRHHSFPYRPEIPVMGKIEKNPFHEEAAYAARMLPKTFLLNVVQDGGHRVLAAVAGHLDRAFLKGADECRRFLEVVLPEKVDITVASPGGFPRDINLWQAQKAVAAAEMVTKEGGTIIVPAECRQGTGGETFARWLREASTPDEVIERFNREGFAEGSSKAWMFARALKRFNIIFVTQGIPAKDLRSMFLGHADTIGLALDMAKSRLGRTASVAVLPYGSDVIPTIGGWPGIEVSAE